MRTIAIINQKGGCGKTTTSINLAACLARLGQKTLLVDMDPQGHCAVGLAVPEEQIERTVFDALLEDRDGKPVKLADTVWQIATDYDLAPSNIKLAGFEQLFAGRIGREDRLKKAIEPLSHLYRWCIIDCPPSVGLITFNALRACDEAIVPVETGYFSLHGLAKMMETLEILREKCDKEILVRILPTLYDTRTKLAREVLSELRAKFKEYLMESTVNFNTKLKEAASFGQPISEYDPGSRGYKDFVNLARELMGQRPIQDEVTPMDKLSRPAELVQRAKQLAQLTNVQFGRNFVTEKPAVSQPAPVEPIVSEPEPISSGSGTMSVSGEDSVGTIADALERGQTSFSNRFGTQSSSSLSMASADEELADSKPMRGIFGPSDSMPMDSGRVGTSVATVAPISMAPPSLAPAMQVRKTTEQKLEDFYGVKKIGDEVIFAVQFKEARKVLIAGDFNNWSPMSTPMLSRGRPGEFWMCMPLPRGRYRYRFVVDGKWVTDPNNEFVETNQFGELNNVIEVD
jgi:chromosome partitioning protein